MSFFSIFSRKNYCLMPIYIFKSKNVHSLITHYSHANILSKKRPFSQKNCALMSFFFKFSMKNHCCHAHTWSKLIQFCQSNTLYYGPNKPIGCPFFPISHKKITAVMPMFCQQNVYSLKTRRSHVHIL